MLTDIQRTSLSKNFFATYVLCPSTSMATTKNPSENGLGPQPGTARAGCVFAALARAQSAQWLSGHALSDAQKHTHLASMP